MKIIKKAKERAEQLENGNEDGNITLLILIHYYKAIIAFIRNKYPKKHLKSLLNKLWKLEKKWEIVYIYR